MGDFPQCSVIVATRDRPKSLERMLESLLAQDHLPSEIIVSDGSSDDRTDTVSVCSQIQPAFSYRGTNVICRTAGTPGAAPQRNEAISWSSGQFVIFVDDDVIFEPNCIGHLLDGIKSNPGLGGVSAMISNQRFLRPGLVGRLLGHLVSGIPCGRLDWAGKYLAPGLTMQAADEDFLPPLVEVEWLHTTCVIYRREALPSPPFPSFFSGGSFGEDFALSQIVRRDWSLANARTARVFHDSQPGDHKGDARRTAAQTAANWLRIINHVTHETRRRDRTRLALVLAYRALGNAFGAAGLRSLIPTFAGYCQGWRDATTRP